MRVLVLSVCTLAVLFAACDERGAVTIGGDDAGAAGESPETGDAGAAGSAGSAACVESGPI